MSFIVASFNVDPFSLAIDGDRRGSICTFHYANHRVDWASTWVYKRTSFHSCHVFNFSYFWLATGYQLKISDTACWSRLNDHRPYLSGSQYACFHEDSSATAVCSLRSIDGCPCDAFNDCDHRTPWDFFFKAYSLAWSDSSRKWVCSGNNWYLLQEPEAMYLFGVEGFNKSVRVSGGGPYEEHRDHQRFWDTNQATSLELIVESLEKDVSEWCHLNSSDLTPFVEEEVKRLSE